MADLRGGLGAIDRSVFHGPRGHTPPSQANHRTCESSCKLVSRPISRNSRVIRGERGTRAWVGAPQYYRFGQEGRYKGRTFSNLTSTEVTQYVTQSGENLVVSYLTSQKFVQYPTKLAALKDETSKRESKARRALEVKAEAGVTQCVLVPH